MFETSFSKVKWNNAVYRSKCRLEVDVDQMHEGEKNRLGVQDARISAVPHPHCTHWILSHVQLVGPHPQETQLEVLN